MNFVYIVGRIFCLLVYVIIIIKCIYFYFSKCGILFYVKMLLEYSVFNWGVDDRIFIICRVIE